MYGDEWPLRVTGIASAAESEWRIGQQTPERTCEGWLLVYVKSGMVEELCDTHRVLLRAGRFCSISPQSCLPCAQWAKFRRRCSAWNLPRTAVRWILSAAAICGSATPKKAVCASWQKRCARCSSRCRMPARCPPAARKSRLAAKSCKPSIWHSCCTCWPAAATHPQTKPPCPRRAGAGSPCGKRAPVLCAEH
mgnify:CR=1 FL=1